MLCYMLFNECEKCALVYHLCYQLKLMAGKHTDNYASAYFSIFFNARGSHEGPVLPGGKTR